LAKYHQKFQNPFLNRIETFGDWKIHFDDIHDFSSMFSQWFNIIKLFCETNLFIHWKPFIGFFRLKTFNPRFKITILPIFCIQDRWKGFTELTNTKEKKEWNREKNQNPCQIYYLEPSSFPFNVEAKGIPLCWSNK
jgi:hypothetical protein